MRLLWQFCGSVVAIACLTATSLLPTTSAQAVPATASAPQQAVGDNAVTVPPNIDATGLTDVAVALNEFVASVPDGSTIVFPADATYRIETPLRLLDRNDLTLEGNGALLYATTVGYRERSQLSVVGGDQIVIRGFRVRGSNPSGGPNGTYDPALEAQHGVELRGTTHALVENNTITDVWGDFVYVGWGRTRATPSDIVIRGNVMARNARQGVSVTRGQRVLVMNNDISSVRRTVFDLEPNNANDLVEDVTIRENTIGWKRLNFLSAHGQGPVDDVMIADNDLTTAMNTSIKAPLGQTRTNWNFVGNHSTAAYGTPLGGLVSATDVHGIMFVGNVHPLQVGRNMVGLRLAGTSCGAVVTDNDLPGSVGQMTGDNPACATPVDLGAVELPSGIDALATLENVTPPQILGEPIVGDALEVVPGTWDQQPVDVSYQWFAGTTAIVGATGPSFVPTVDLVGRAIVVVATATKPGFNPATASSTPTGSVYVVDAVSATIQGSPLLGRKLTVKLGAASTRADVTVQWLRGGVAVPGAIQRDYRLTAADLGHRISVRVTDARPDPDQVTTTASTEPVRSVPRLRAQIRQTKPGWLLRVKVSAKAVRPVSGRVRLVDHGRTIAVVKLNSQGRALKVLSADAIAGRSLSVVFPGNTLVAPVTLRVKVRGQ